MNMRRLVFIAVLFTLFASAAHGQTQATVAEKKPGKRFELGITQNILLGQNQLLGSAGVYAGVGVSKNFKLFLGADFGKQLFHNTFSYQLLSLSLAHEFHFSPQFSFQVGAGAGATRQEFADKSVLWKPVGVLNLQPRINFSPITYIGLDAKALFGKEITSGSLLGVTWGVRF